MQGGLHCWRAGQARARLSPLQWLEQRATDAAMLRWHEPSPACECLATDPTLLLPPSPAPDRYDEMPPEPLDVLQRYYESRCGLGWCSTAAAAGPAGWEA